jgi:hypothetical protein
MSDFDVDPQYLEILERLVRGDGNPVDLADELHARYLALPRAGATPAGLPYPSPTDPIAQGADAIRALAEAIDANDHPWTNVTLGSGWTTGSGSAVAQVMRDGNIVFFKGILQGGTAGSTAGTVPDWARPVRSTTVPIAGQSGATGTFSVTTAGVITFPGIAAVIQSTQLNWTIL